MLPLNCVHMRIKQSWNASIINQVQRLKVGMGPQFLVNTIFLSVDSYFQKTQTLQNKKSQQVPNNSHSQTIVDFSEFSVLSSS